jgi:hypothetical protein
MRLTAKSEQAAMSGENDAAMLLDVMLETQG